MDVDLSRIPAGTAGWCALVDHALALGDLSEVDYLELKGKLPFGEKSDRKRSAVVVARALLGLSNRMPDSAAKHLGGYGVVFVGLKEQDVVAAEAVDGAVLHDALQPYVGDDGPGWDYTFINHPDGLVLAVTVDPPHWGDRIHVCRKGYSADDGTLTVRDGEVFVRVPGKTRPATSSDLADLERRRDRSPSTGAQIRVEYGGTFDRVHSESVINLIREIIDETADSLLSGVGTNRIDPSGGAMGSFLSRQEDRRSPERFRSGVEEWRDESYAKVEDVSVELFRHQLARGRWMIQNESRHYLETVRAQIEFPPGIVVLMRTDTDYCDHGDSFNPWTLLPDPPPKWGSLKPLDIRPLVPSKFDRLAPRALVRDPEFEVDVTAHGTRVTWHVGDLPPSSTERGDELFAVVTDNQLNDLSVRWWVTARGVDHVFEGQAGVTCAQEHDVRLTWTRRPQQAEDEPSVSEQPG